MSIIILDWCGQASLSLMKIYKLIVWLFIYSLIYVPLKNVSFIWIRRPCRWRATKLSLMLGAKDLWAGKDLCRATTMKRDLDFSGLTWRIAPFSRLLRHAWATGRQVRDHPNCFLLALEISLSTHNVICTCKTLTNSFEIQSTASTTSANRLNTVT